MLCACGCGGETKPAPYSFASRGWVKGQPVKFVRGHNGNHQPVVKRYRMKSHNQKLVLAHRLRAERALGHPLPPKAIVHHADGSRDEHAPLVICPDDAYHMLLHKRMRVLKAGGNPNTDKICSTCKLVKPISEFSKNRTTSDGKAPECRDCVTERARVRRSAA